MGPLLEAGNKFCAISGAARAQPKQNLQSVSNQINISGGAIWLLKRRRRKSKFSV
jgi:hypothetical protein